MQRNTQIRPGQVDWSERGRYVSQRHGIELEQSDEALGDPDRVVIDPDYNSVSGRSTRVVGFSMSAVLSSLSSSCSTTTSCAGSMPGYRTAAIGGCMRKDVHDEEAQRAPEGGGRRR